MKKLLITLCLFFALTLCTNAQPGSLDPTFGEDGKVIIDSLASEAATQLKDGRIVTYSTPFLVALFPDGKVDTSFGEKGKVNTNALSKKYIFYGIAEQPDGKIILGGMNPYDYVLLRYNKDGSIDESFGNAGTMITDLGGDEDVFAILTQPDGKILVTGARSDYPGGGWRPYISRHNTNGSLDKSFGDGGKWIFLNFYGYSQSIALQTDGKILIGGDLNTYDTKSFLVARFNTNGIPDSSFGTNGISLSNVGEKNDYLRSIAVQADGKIVGAGSDGYEDFFNFQRNFGVIRLNTDGSLDKEFGEEGTVSIQFGERSGIPNAVLIQANRKIIITGLISPNTIDFGLVRLTPEGNLDEDFGAGGIVVTDIKGSDEPSAAFIEKDGKILVVGRSYDYGFYYDLSLARYLGDPIETTPIAKIKYWLKDKYVNWQGIYSSGAISYYTLERKTGTGGSFAQIAKVQAKSVTINAESAVYAYNLANAAAANSTQTNYYRIKAISTDGSFVYSDVFNDSFLPHAATLTITPNPVQSTARLNGLQAGVNSVIKVLNRNGHVVFSGKTSGTSYSINTSGLKSGVYYVNVASPNTSEGGEPKVEKVSFVKE